MKKELLNQIEVILSSKDITRKQTFENLKGLLLKGYTLSVKQQAEIRQAFRSIIVDQHAKIICNTLGDCGYGCGGPMAWAFIIQKGNSVLYKGADRCIANRLNDRNTACYFALTDCLMKIQELKLDQKKINITTNSLAVVNEMNGKWPIYKTHHYEQRCGVKKLMSSFPNIQISESQSNFKRNGICKMVEDYLKYAEMKSVVVNKAA